MTWKPRSSVPSRYPASDDDYSEDIRIKASYSEDSLRKAYTEAAATSLDFSERLLLRHNLVVGATGSGKTTHTCHIIHRAMEKPHSRCFVVDVKKEYRRLPAILQAKVRVLAVGDEPRARFNPLAPRRA